MIRKSSPVIKEKIHGKPDVRIGKNGITEGLVKEISNLLEKKKVIKIKANKNIAQTKAEFEKILNELASKIENSMIVDVRGRTAILAKKGRFKE